MFPDWYFNKKQTVFVLMTLIFAVLILSNRAFSKDEEIEIPVRTFFNIYHIFYDYINNDPEYLNSLNNFEEDKINKLIHLKLSQTIKEVFVPKLANKYIKTVKRCVAGTEDYQIYFNGWENVRIKKLTIKKTTKVTAYCKVFYQSEESSNLTEYDNYDLKNLVRDYKIKNFSQVQFNQAEYGDFVLYTEKQCEFRLKFIRNKWYISWLKDTYLRSQLKLINIES